MHGEQKSPLLWIHAGLIAWGIVFCFGYALYDWIVRPEGGESLLLPAGFAVAGVVLSVYLARFVKGQLR